MKKILSVAHYERIMERFTYCTCQNHAAIISIINILRREVAAAENEEQLQCRFKNPAINNLRLSMQKLDATLKRGKKVLKKMYDQFDQRYYTKDQIEDLTNDYLSTVRLFFKTEAAYKSLCKAIKSNNVLNTIFYA